MKTDPQQHDEPIDLGAAQVETRGTLILGPTDVENDRAFFNGGIVADD